MIFKFSITSMPFLQLYHISLQSFKAVGCLGKFYRQIMKTIMMTSSWRHFMLLRFENLTFVQLNIGYHLCKFQSWLSASHFMEVSVRPSKSLLWRHYHVISYHWASKLAYFLEHDIGYQPSKYQCSKMSGSNFIEGVDPPVLQRDKKAQC